LSQIRKPKPNLAIIGVALSFGFLRTNKDLVVKRPVAARYYLSWFLAFGQWAFISWLLANFVADNGGRASSNAPAVHLSHPDWALQSHDLVANILVLTLIAIAQIIKFVYVLFAIKPYKELFSRGRNFTALIALFILGFAALMWRLSVVDHQPYRLYLPNSMIFDAVWLVTSIIAFSGLTGFWKYAGLSFWNKLNTSNRR